jgi:hypothetical protein
MKKWLAVAGLLLFISGSAAEEPTALLSRIKAVGKEGAGNVEAARAWKELTQQGPEVLLDTLAALDDASPAAANWLRSAVETIAEHTLAAGKPLPAGKLEAFVRETRHAGAARRLAYDWLVRVDPAAVDRLLPGMLDDPGAELRRDAVAIVLKDAQQLFDKDNKPAATTAYQKALEHARDRDQVQLAAGQLKKLGVEVDLTSRFGFITRWMLVGPFDNTKGTGFHTTFPPEKGIDLTAGYEGKDKKPLRWVEHVTKANLGLVDFNKQIGQLKGATAFAYTTFVSTEARPVDIRAMSNNAIRIYLNGKEIYFREEYHHGTRMDQHIGKATLKAGRNEMLIKVCQNEQTDSWAEQWSFQLRICDHLGGAVPLTVLKNKAAGATGEQE